MPVISRNPATMRRRGQRGYTLIEILVAAVLLTGGLIGLASMQASGTRLNNSAYLRTQASVLAYDIVDRMRANRAAVRTAAYDLGLADATPATPSSVANIDLIQWRGAADYYLPAGNGSVDTTVPADPADPIQVVVTVQWADGPNAADIVDFVLVTDI